MFFSLEALRSIYAMEKEPLEALFQKIIEEYSKYDGSENKKLEIAFEIGKKTHAHQMRESGTMYFSHPLIVAWLMLPFHPNANLLIATLLHDAIEDSLDPEKTTQEIKEAFGEEVLFLIDGVSKVGSISSSKGNEKKQTIQKIFKYAAKDVRILIIKLFDRLHNILTLAGKKDPKKRAAKAKETLEIFLPAARKLGIWELQKNLEDACAMYLSPDAFESVYPLLQTQSIKAKKLYDEITEHIAEKNILEEGNLEYVPYSFSTLLQRNLIGENVLPEYLFFVEVRVKTQQDCYTFLSKLIETYPHKDEFLQDYILNPKDNWYKGIHTTVVVNNAHLIRFHILSEEIAKRNTLGAFLEVERKQYQLSLFNSEISDDTNISSENFVELLQNDMLLPKICVHNPEKGEKYIPQNSSALDAGIRFFPEFFFQIQKIRINNTPVGFDTLLKKNDIITFEFGTDSQISLEWILQVRSAYGKFQIQKILKEQNIEQKEIIGEKSLQEAFDAVKLGNVYSVFENNSEIFSAFHAKSSEELFHFIAEGMVIPDEIVSWIGEKQDTKVSWWNSIISYIFPKQTNAKEEVTIKIESNTLGMQEMTQLFEESCKAQNIQEKNISFRKEKENLSMIAKITANHKKNIFLFFSELRRSSHISKIIFYHSFTFYALLLTALVFPFIAGAMIINLAHPSILLSLLSIAFFIFSIVWSSKILARYFFVLKNNVPVLLSIFGINAIAITLWLYRSFSLFFSHESYSTLTLIGGIIFLLAFFIPIMAISKQKSSSFSLKKMNTEEWKEKKKEKILGYIFRIGAGICFGSAPILAKYLAPENTNGMFVTSLSITFAALLLLPFFLFDVYKNGLGNKKSYNGLFWVVTVSAGLFFLAYFSSVQFTTASNPVFILNLAPLIGFIFAIFFLPEKAKYLQNTKDTFWMFLFFIMGAMGTFFLIINKGNTFTGDFSEKIIGDFLAIGAMIFDVVYTLALIYYAKSQNALSGIRFIMWQTVILAIMLFPITLYYFLHFPIPELSHLSGIFLLGFLYFIVGYFLAYESFKRLDGMINYLLMNFFPLITVSLEIFFFDLPLTTYLILGAAFIIISSISAEVLNTKCEKKEIQ